MSILRKNGNFSFLGNFWGSIRGVDVKIQSNLAELIRWRLSNKVWQSATSCVLIVTQKRDSRLPGFSGHLWHVLILTDLVLVTCPLFEQKISTDMILFQPNVETGTRVSSKKDKFVFPDGIRKVKSIN